jgi:membrane associated rhomboid family serine protease
MQVVRDYFNNFKPLLIFIAILWGVYAISVIFMPLNIQQYGLQPRKISGLIGIATSPFLHAGISHLMANTVGLLTFGVIFTAIEGKSSFLLMLEIVVLQGILLWMIGRSANNIGTSGLIFGLFGYLLFLGYFQRKFRYILVSLFVLFSYGSMVFGVLPASPHISWEGHLFGLFVGGAEAKMKS